MAQTQTRKPSTQDETLICERCGVTFLWTVEEQHQQARTGTAAPPLHCPGCRRLLPPPGWERGVVKWYNVRRKYGFIVRHAGPELFAHRSRFADVGRLHPGDLVEFRVEESTRGPMAVDVRLLLRAKEMEKSPQPSAGPEDAASTRRARKSS